ncbi:hypothetical protein RhiLY_07772 [Ceratobasidium sp. AG-Ba]|nr:hypothetical protein RhiLY_07772 [Ceratobasidium sp. AG-Ba]
MPVPVPVPEWPKSAGVLLQVAESCKILAQLLYVLIMRKEANMADFKRWLEVRPPEGDGRKSLASSMETLIIRDEIQEDVTTTKADIDQESHFDFEEWEKQGKQTSWRKP